jgi:hypothetical protein
MIHPSNIVFFSYVSTRLRRSSYAIGQRRKTGDLVVMDNPSKRRIAPFWKA